MDADDARQRRVLNLAKNKRLGPARRRTNILPKQLTRVELYQGYRRLLADVYSWKAYADRICGFVTIAQNTRIVDRPLKGTIDDLIAKLELEGEAAHEVRRMWEHTLATAPQLLRRVKDVIVQHARYYQTIQDTLVDLDRNIERESSGDMILEPDNRAAPLPVRFKEELGRILPRASPRLPEPDHQVVGA